MAAVEDVTQIENCHLPASMRWNVKCPLRYESLKETVAPDVRFCESCKESVFFCDTFREVQDHALQGHCVAFRKSIVPEATVEPAAPTPVAGVSAGRPSAAVAYVDDRGMPPTPPPGSRVVVTVPISWDDDLRARAKVDAEVAGLEVLRVINEPTAVAIRHDLDQTPDVSRHLVVYWGPDSMEATVFEIEDGIFEVVAAWKADEHGLAALDQTIVEWATSRAGAAPRTSQTFLEDCAKARRVMLETDLGRTTIDAPWADQGVQLSRPKMDSLAKTFATGGREAMREGLRSGVDLGEIRTLVVHGGAHRSQALVDSLSSVVPGARVLVDGGDITAAIGAAKQANILIGGYGRDDDLLMGLIDITALSYGLVDEDGRCCVVVPRNCTVPVRKRVAALSHSDTFSLRVVAGECVDPVECVSIGTVVGNVQPDTPLTVSYDVDANHVLTVTVTPQFGDEISSQFPDAPLATERGYADQIEKLIRAGERAPAETIAFVILPPVLEDALTKPARSGGGVGVERSRADQSALVATAGNEESHVSIQELD